ncbi:MAG: hypothetical protein J6T26_04770 [Firmicutes bacterium]|nr:hypothetical protein [Bacillota bacterium]
MNKKENPVFKRTEESYAKNRIYMQEYGKSEKGRLAQAKYTAKITTVNVKLNPDKDADILAALDPDKPLAPQLKDLIRLALRAKEMFQ